MGASWVGDSTLDYDEKYIEAVDDEEEMKVMMMTRYDKCEHTTGLPPPALPLTPLLTTPPPFPKKKPPLTTLQKNFHTNSLPRSPHQLTC